MVVVVSILMRFGDAFVLHGWVRWWSGAVPLVVVGGEEGRVKERS